MAGSTICRWNAGAEAGASEMTRFIVSCGLVTMLLLSGGSALARELQPQLLPPLQVPGAVTVPERAAPLRWQLSQRFRHDFNSGRGSLSLSPSDRKRTRLTS